LSTRKQHDANALGIDWDRQAKKLATETLSKVGWPTIGLGRGDRCSNVAKGDGRYEYYKSHGSSPAANDRKWWIKSLD